MRDNEALLGLLMYSLEFDYWSGLYPKRISTVSLSVLARLLMEAPYSWKEIMKHNSNSTPLPSSTSVSPMDDLSKLFSSQILGSVALFNMTQLLFVIASNKAMSSISKLGRPTSIESVSVDSISKILLWFSSESDKDSATLNLSRSIKEDSKSSDSEGGSIDPELLVVSLKLCLKLFDGSSVGPSELSRIKNANPGLASPRRTIFSNDYDPEPPSPVYDVGQQQQQLQAPSSLVSSPRQPVLVLPEKPKPYGSPTSYTTRICLALSRTLITVYAVSLDRTGESQRRVMSLRQEAQRWCGAEASAGLENAAFASGGSSAITQAAAGGGGGGGDRGERERSGSSNIGYGSRPSGSSASVFLGSSTTVPPKRSNTNENNKRRSMVVKGSALEGLLVSALSGTGEVHGNLAMEVGCVALEVETLAERGWKLEDLAVDRISNGCCSSRADETVVDRASLNTRKGLVQQLVRLASRRVRDGVIARMKMEEEHLDEALSPFLMKG
ncbi:hypothetical protein BDR26DRAFT_327583 [Obelidium mucronatum]|nr:hypothetical protein BDR26DRAFT_327583 [Obelidium mucronatum]